MMLFTNSMKICISTVLVSVSGFSIDLSGGFLFDYNVKVNYIYKKNFIAIVYALDAFVEQYCIKGRCYCLV